MANIGTRFGCESAKLQYIKNGLQYVYYYIFFINCLETRLNTASFYCSLCGFNNAVTMKTMAHSDVEYLQTFISKRLVGMFELAKKDLDADDKLLFFGSVYASCPAKFELQQGEKKLITEIVAHVKSKIEINGYQYYQQAKRTNWNMCVSCSVGKYFGERRKPCNQRQNDQIPRSTENIRTDLFNGAAKIISAFDKNVVPDISMVNTITNDENKLSGEILCIFCPTKILVHHHKGAPYTFWVLSNYKRHLGHQQARDDGNAKEPKNVPVRALMKPSPATDIPDISENPRNNIPSVNSPLNIKTFYDQLCEHNVAMMNSSLKNSEQEEDVRFNIDAVTTAVP